jgi:hypothetical protein
MAMLLLAACCFLLLFAFCLWLPLPLPLPLCLLDPCLPIDVPWDNFLNHTPNLRTTSTLQNADTDIKARTAGN